jgi:hypothetical protein
MIEIRQGQAPPPLQRAGFSKRIRAAFIDPAFRVEGRLRGRLLCALPYRRLRRAGPNMHGRAGRLFY